MKEIQRGKNEMQKIEGKREKERYKDREGEI